MEPTHLVTIRCWVGGQDTDRLAYYWSHNSGDFIYADDKALVSVEALLAVGDYVVEKTARLGDIQRRYKIIAISGEQAWLQHHTGYHVTANLANLLRA